MMRNPSEQAPCEPKERLSIGIRSEEASLRDIAWIIALAAVAVTAIVHVEEVILVLGRIADAFAPIVYGAVIAYLLNLIVVRFEGLRFFGGEGALTRKVRRPLCIALAIGIVLLALGLTATTAALQLKDSLAIASQGLATAWAALLSLAAPLGTEGRIASMLGSEAPDWNELVNRAAEWLGGFDGILGSAASMGDAVVGTVVDLSLGLVFACYLLMAKERVLAGANTLARTVLPAPWREKVSTACSTVNSCLSRFIVGQCLEAIILGSLCALGMTLLRLPHALTIGLVVGVTALVPIFGAWIGGLAGALMILPSSGSQAVVFVTFLVALQQVENHLIYPRTMGEATGISSIWVMAAVVVGGALGGIPGMVLAVPLTAAATQLLKGFWKRGGIEVPGELSDDLANKRGACDGSTRQ